MLKCESKSRQERTFETSYSHKTALRKNKMLIEYLELLNIARGGGYEDVVI